MQACEGAALLGVKQEDECTRGEQACGQAPDAANATISLAFAPRAALIIPWSGGHSSFLNPNP